MNAEQLEHLRERAAETAIAAEHSGVSLSARKAAEFAPADDREGDYVVLVITGEVAHKYGDLVRTLGDTLRKES